MSVCASPRQHYDCLIISTADNIGGMERVVCGLARGLAAARWSVHTVFPRSPKTAAILDWCHEQQVQAEASPAVHDAAARHTLGGILAFSRYVRRLAPRSVNLHYGDNFISLKDVLAVRLAGVRRCVVTVHHPTPWSAANARKRLMTRLAAQLADAVVAVSEATRRVLVDAGIPERKVHLIYSGLPAPERLPTRAEARARLGLPESAFVVASLARLESYKGIADLVEAVAQVSDSAQEIVLVVGGDGPERAHLEELARERLGPWARFLGRLPDTADLYAAADVFALPSYLEGFGLVYLEAAFYGVPSIGTRVGGVPEAVLDGETGLLVEPGDRAGLASAIDRLRDVALRQVQGRTARERVHRQFTETAMAHRYARILEQPKLERFGRAV